MKELNLFIAADGGMWAIRLGWVLRYFSLLPGLVEYEDGYLGWFCEHAYRERVWTWGWLGFVFRLRRGYRAPETQGVQ
jgi:hypothetical protein